MTIDQVADLPLTEPVEIEPAAAPIALRLQDVGVGYGDTAVVSDISFDLPVGQWLAVIGPNGAGKSTLLRAIVGVLQFSGTIEVAGSRSGDAGRRARTSTAKRIGYVPQKPILPLGMSTAEYVLLGRTAHLNWFQSESRRDRQRVHEVLEQLDLASMAGRPVTELSGGEGQRATLARALVQEASVLVLDEPTSALDLAHQITVLELVDSLRREHDLTVVTAMHDLSIASRFADRLLLVADGGPAALGTSAQVLTEPLLTRHYNTPVTVMEGPDGGLVVVPLRTSSIDNPTPKTNHPASGDQP